ncbi:tRNA-splicing endonuclease subunit Sen15 isoform X1 [Anolis carolinensis]|uniref:tRNA-splicing endonuclease subunit Sen15 isoform X1 n=1 Tax=Anolis carolinensis TaxID=28377 RepID=UPI002F2B5A9A
MEAPGSSCGHGGTGGEAPLGRGFGSGSPSPAKLEEGKEGGAAAPAQWAPGGSWLEAHPAFTRMMSLDVADSSGVYAAFLVYLDLLEVRNWHEVSYFGLGELQLVCLRGREKEDEDLQMVVPTPVHLSFSHERMRQIMKSAWALEEETHSPLAITLAVVETESTIVYYKLTDGFVTPEPPSNTEDTGNKEWRKKKRKKFPS